ncbi:MAG TPA: hydratase, partial [Bacillota bacterium]|nr:hydratase [Bacillota bacterium]
ANGFVKNKVLEFVGNGIEGLSVEFRNGIDVMTTETTCLSSVWTTDEKVRSYLDAYGRADAYKKLEPSDCAYYDGVVHIDLSSVEPMIALPFHPSNAYTIREFNANSRDILELTDKKITEQFGRGMGLASKISNGRFVTTQGVIAGCAGGIYDNICAAAQILKGKKTGTDFSLSVYPASQSVYYSLIKNGVITSLMSDGASIRTAFCGPCFGAGDVPANNVLSLRHTTRNFINREGSKPGEGQIAAVALMDARSIAATALNKGSLTGADEVEYSEYIPEFRHEESVYAERVYNGFGKPHAEDTLIYGPNITGYPEMSALPDHLLLKMCAVINDPVTTTDELIPSGETSSYRSNPLRLAQFTLSRKAPDYVELTKNIEESAEYRAALIASRMIVGNGSSIGSGSVIFARKPGDGSAREQAASSQRVLGTRANFALDYATKRYRSNLINWGILPFVVSSTDFAIGEYVLIPNVRQHLMNRDEALSAFIIKKGDTKRVALSLPDMTDEERAVMLDGSLMNHCKKLK